ncbi:MULTISPECIES: DUF4190 domain-containing protein [unclassified Gilliamella]|uniref:DUF4190 domain-containing protein n=1 Tax=unclassified Gilliamella TaxID=2685620 RepID=UPI00226A01B1|nr:MULTISPECIES: DUF4190 domain-containing protein [unclassified Gilliamella]MCX8573781.1 DUF4190 domain-containing protein [Gilliamella sp. B3831]MCX8575591.1 DUF4190 domain-containing protein [Gilliamella sp. B3815]MCX8589792.1 DUF4190 domain-containing protein [Gilliamella sp. B3812]MCX8602693.1 DUF4190 domain-containing protein [Gilliamella sp. B3823]MCX8604990.1 DUF4190 domain-containing protein [Gilliamella sp. B3825]
MDQQQYKATSGLAIAGMSCGISSLVSILVINILSIVAIVLSAVAMSDIKNNNKRGFGFATTGIICGIITLLLWCSFFILVLT